MLTYNEKNNQNEEYMKFDSDIILLGGNKSKLFINIYISLKRKIYRFLILLLFLYFYN